MKRSVLIGFLLTAPNLIRLVLLVTAGVLGIYMVVVVFLKYYFSLPISSILYVIPVATILMLPFINLVLMGLRVQISES